jgi:hypothetical protein
VQRIETIASEMVMAWRMYELGNSSAKDALASSEKFKNTLLIELSRAPAAPAEAMTFALLERHERFHMDDDFKLVRVPVGQSLDFDKDGATRRWLHSDLGTEFHLAGFISTPAKPAQQAPSGQQAELKALREALTRLERAVDMHLGRSSWTQTKELKGFVYSEQVRKELYAAHDEARTALAANQEGD